MSLLSVQGLRIGVADQPLLQGLSWELDSGEALALCGPSGLGKTTLLRVLAGLQDAQAGEVRLNGKLPPELGWPVYRRKVVLVAQQPVLLDATVEDNLKRVFSYASSSSSFEATRACELAGELGLPDDLLSRRALSLSVGQQQRTCLLRALLMGPEVLLLDEPTSALDPESTERVEKLLKKAGPALILVSHQHELAESLASQILELGTFRP